MSHLVGCGRQCAVGMEMLGRLSTTRIDSCLALSLLDPSLLFLNWLELTNIAATSLPPAGPWRLRAL